MIKFNKIAIIVALFVMLGALTGCGIGYNKTLFITKSNVGLDASVSPRPTFDLALSRFEGVITPGFKKGKKLPVLASFRFKNKDRISPAVGSTYAAGDAAIAMAALFGDETDGDEVENRLCIVNAGIKYDSSLKLGANKPVIKKGLLETWFPGIFHPQEFQTTFVEPVIFGTDTSFGLKVAWSTAPAPPAPFPDSVKFGYNRTEIGLAPITINEKDNTFNVKMASLLATADTGVAIDEADNQVKLEHIQYFATGKAATLLALQQEIRKAMLARLDPNAKYYAKRFAESIKGRSRTILISMLGQIQTMLSGADDPKANALAENMNSVESLVPDVFGFTRYRGEPGKKMITAAILPTEPTSSLKKDGLKKATSYRIELNGSLGILGTALQFNTGTVNVDGQNVSATDLANKFEEANKKLEEFDQRLLSHPDIIAACKYLLNL
jgi:hypothetical protein